LTTQRDRHDRPDRRIRKTRQALRDALVELILEKGYAAVTVQDIVDRADVGRTTFYAHFGDKDELLMSGLEEIHGPLGSTPVRGLTPLLREFVDHARRQRRLYRAVFGLSGAAPLRARMENQVSDHIRRDLAAQFPSAEPPTVTMVARMTTAGFLGLVAWWLETDEMPAQEALNRVVAGFVDCATSLLSADRGTP
jgi:AcrR family transcriptional regulator